MKKQKKKEMDTPSYEYFKKIFDRAAYGSGYESVFNDFLTMCICAFSQNPITGLSHYEEEYLRIIEPYKQRETLNYFAKLLAILVAYMEEHLEGGEGNDLLGSFFEREITNGRNGQFFTPFPVCTFMASIVDDTDDGPQNVLDPCCGSGRMLMAHSKRHAKRNNLYGVDIDPLCVKITAINLFLNGRTGEVLCANALDPDDFRFSYRISHLPFGIFKVVEKEKSVLWQMNRRVFDKKPQGQLTLF